MSSIKKELPQDDDQSAIVNMDAEFENPSLDPGFVFQDTGDDTSELDGQKEDTKSADTQNEPGTGPGAAGLGELDGTNPGSNHHPMDS
ncbi:hypothetical protein QG516_03375 [Pedobacter gandavensis]|uniref:hypothetical protein n=1 Tax=Pedobacter gandavensis TaxID=2679963 RepID=UPI00247A38CF|nr:hypothetical protein [Pedobacter gandavensis]WGQ10695.1 hypothetical protein QG516_03375 [Pedobacter gandavensis]